MPARSSSPVDEKWQKKFIEGLVKKWQEISALIRLSYFINVKFLNSYNFRENTIVYI